MTNLKLNPRNKSAEKYLHYYQDDVESIITSKIESKLIISNSGSGKKTLMQGMMKNYVAKGYPVL